MWGSVGHLIHGGALELRVVSVRGGGWDEISFLIFFRPACFWPLRRCCVPSDRSTTNTVPPGTVAIGPGKAHDTNGSPGPTAAVVAGSTDTLTPMPATNKGTEGARDVPDTVLPEWASPKPD